MLGRVRLKFEILLVSASLWLGLGACSVPTDDPATTVGKQSIIFQVNAALTAGECDDAITLIEPLYNSENTDNEVRRLRASAHSCKAGINFFPLIADLAVGSFGGNGLWRTITQLFPSSAGDGKAEASYFATDALLSWLNPGVVVWPPYDINSSTENPGSITVSDRTNASNLYLSLVSMSTIGTLHNRYGDPNGSYAPQQALPWTTLAAMDETGCAYAAALLNLSDALDSVGSAYTALSSISTAVSLVSAGFDAACDLGCTNLCPSLTCNGCPDTLRHYTACERATPTTQDADACAAAGLVTLMNSPAGWQ